MHQKFQGYMWVPVPVVLLVPTSALPLPTGPAMGGPPPLIRSSIDSRRVVISWQFSRRAHRLVWKRENRPLLKTTWLDKPWFKNTSKVLKYRVFWFPDFRIIQFCFKKTYWNTDLCCQTSIMLLNFCFIQKMAHNIKSPPIIHGYGSKPYAPGEHQNSW